MGIKAYITLVAAAVTAFSAKSDYDIPWNASTVVNAGGGNLGGVLPLLGLDLGVQGPGGQLRRDIHPAGRNL